MNGAPTAFQRFFRGILPENPVYRQMLGMCATLAVTNNIQAAVTMAAAVLFVLVCANLIISLIRHWLTPYLRIVIFTLTIATFVTVADRALAAFVYPMSKMLGPYIPLIIVNCIIICRCEVCAAKQGPITAVADAIGQSLGFGLALVSLAAVRELLGSGMWFGIRILPEAWPDWVIMVLPPGAFLTFGLLLGLVNWFTARRAGKEGA